MTTSDTQSLDKTSIEKRNPPHRIVTMFYVIACTLATLQFLRSYFIIDSPYLNALKYELGNERMPFQARILMSVLMRHAESSSIMTQIAGKMRGPLRSPTPSAYFWSALFRWQLSLSSFARFIVAPRSQDSLRGCPIRWSLP